MFSGIVEEMGTIRNLIQDGSGLRIEIFANIVLDDVKVGASIAVNGCCLTVVELSKEPAGARWWAAHAIEETLRLTDISSLKKGDSINLERAICYGERVGGHLIQGHVDGISTITNREDKPDGSAWMTFQIPPRLMRYIILKGSVAIDGISLTIASIDDGEFSVGMIPHTLKVTVLGNKKKGASVNVETDMIVKTLEKLRSPHEPCND